MVSISLLQDYPTIAQLSILGRGLTSYIATKADVESHFNTHGTGEITEIKLMNGFGFIEYKDAMDARDVVPGKIYHGKHVSYSCLSLSQPSTAPTSWVSA